MYKNIRKLIFMQQRKDTTTTEVFLSCVGGCVCVTKRERLK